MEDALTELINDGKIRKYNYGEAHVTYMITECGQKCANEISNIDNRILLKIKNSKSDWDEWNKEGI